MFLKKWKEVYCTLELDKYFTAKNILDGENIKYKTETVDNSLRLSMNNIGRTRAALSRSGDVKNYYKILVEEKDEAQARSFLSKI